MLGLEFGNSVANRHAPLVQRASAIVTALGQDDAILLRDAGDASPVGARPACVTLDRGTSRAIVRDGGTRRFTLRYDDPASEASLAALVACVTRPGAPIAADPESLSVLALAERLALSDIPVLINGPTGTGKEVLSRFIHDRSNRRTGPFIAVNCAAMPEAMLEALLFGHKKGAFTGATEASEGFFRAADGGTLLLDEIAEMPINLQAKLLRALQESEVVPIGATQPIKIDVRIIACANRDLPTEVAEGRFRPDLYYRLNVFPLALRSLRERPDDVAALAFALLLRHAPQGRDLPWISDTALAMLKLHGWAGNVRELENVMRRAILLADGQPEIRPEHVVFDSPARLVSSDASVLAPTADMPSTRKLSNIVQISEARAIMETLEACGGSRVAAARQLGISERTLRYRLASFREAGITTTNGATTGAAAVGAGR
jgi:two-component system response regulator FlrC